MKMKIYYKLFSLFLILFIAFAGCKKNNPVSPVNNNLTIQIQGEDDGQGNYIFSINPNTTINLTAVMAS